MELTVLFSFLLVICGLAVSAVSGRSKLLNGLIGIEALGCVLLLIAYVVANQFTGEGINSAVWYHFRYGLGGAGFREYRTIIIVTTFALLFAPLIILGVMRWRRRKPRRVAVLIVGQLLFIAAFASNPGVRDLTRLAQTHSPATADFYRHYQPASATPISSDHPSFVFIFAESFERTYFDEQRLPRTDEGNGTEPESLAQPF